MFTQKLYSPLYASIVDNDNLENYDCDYWRDEISQQEAAYYYNSVHEAILKMRLPEETERGLMHYYNYHGRRDDTVDQKVRSLLVDVEEHGEKLWGVATIEVAEDLTPEEYTALRDYLTGQYSDGMGESFEQREIGTSNGELYVSLWSSEKSFRIMTEDEFQQHLGPEQITGAAQRHKPRCPMIGADGNVFNLIGLVSNTLRDHGMADAANEMRERVTSCGSYSEALAIMTEYVDPVSGGGTQHSPGFDMSM